MRFVASPAWRGSFAIRRGAGDRFRQHLVVRARMVHQAFFGSPAGRDSVRSQEVLLGQWKAGQEKPGVRAAVGRHQTHQGVGVGQVGVLIVGAHDTGRCRMRSATRFR
jgi:hypothetical protein